MKYIIVNHTGIETPIIFSELLSHNEVKPDHLKVVSAGFCSFYSKNDETKFSCWGESVSLKSKSRLGVDEEILLKHSQIIG